MKAERRNFIAASGLGALAGLAAVRAHGAALPPSAASPGPALALTPAVTEGPFYLDVGLVRSDITEGRKGVPLELRIRVVDVRAAPLAGYRIDVWHCDAGGLYSGFDGQGPARSITMRGRTFLRGTVRTGDDGVAVLRTIYPGWYAGRTAHIHLKVFNGERRVLTSQLFLPDALSEYLFTNVSAYQRTTLRDTLNRGDGIALEAGPAAFGEVREEADRYVVTATTVVDPEARPQPERPPGPPGRGGPGGPDRSAGNGVRPQFDVNNRGGGLKGSVGVSGGGRAAGPGGPRGPGERPDGPPPLGEGPAHEVLRGDARVAAIVPGEALP